MIVPLLLAASILIGDAEDLSLTARAEAQRKVEQARYAFVIGNTQPLDELYPRSVFEARVAREAAEEEVLKRVFGMVVTPALLAEEFARIEKTTRAPDQWEAIKKALGHDRRLIEETFCRPPLVQRALRARFAFDRSIHAQPHQKARHARASLLAGRAVPGASILRLQRKPEPAQDKDRMMAAARAEATGPRVLRPAAERDPNAPIPIDPEIAAVLEKELTRPGDVTTILEERDQFSVFKLVEADKETWKVTAVRFPKVDFDVWFAEARGGSR